MKKDLSNFSQLQHNADMAGGCPHLDIKTRVCGRVKGKQCQMGMKGCVLFGKIAQPAVEKKSLKNDCLINHCT